MNIIKSFERRYKCIDHEGKVIIKYYYGIDDNHYLWKRYCFLNSKNEYQYSDWDCCGYNLYDCCEIVDHFKFLMVFK